MRHAAVVEGGMAGDLEPRPAAYRTGLADKEIPDPAGGPGLRHHEVDDLAHCLLALEAGEQDVCVVEVALLRPGVVGPGGQREVAAPSGVQDGAEQARGIEPGRAEPVDGAIGAD